MLVLLLFAGYAFPVVIDQVAIVVDRDDIIKDSDITRDLHATEFLNGEPPSNTLVQRKKTAAHLIEQVFIRQEIRIGDYPTATTEEATRELEDLQKQRFPSEAALRRALSKYDLSLPDLREQFRWQLTVLQFINSRFTPAVLISDDEVNKYYQVHQAALRQAHPKDTPAQLSSVAREILVAEQVDKLFFAWLDQHRRDAKVHFLEEQLN